jgi:hydroxymethylbilane synthase
VKLGTRGSQLALWQARAVASRLEALGHEVEVVIVKTIGDRLQDAALSEAGGKRLFVKDLEDALLQGEIDLAVHSAKDLPAIPDGLTIAAALPRADPRDALVVAADRSTLDLRGILSAFASGTLRTVGTSSVRRVAQLSPQMPGASFSPVRGNVDTRLRKVDGGEFDAIVLACAGLRRLGLDSRISAALPVDRCVPAPGQGIVAIETRADDAALNATLGSIHDEGTGTVLAAERSLVEALGGDCRIPLGALARLNGAGIEMEAIVSSLDGHRILRRRSRGSAAHPEVLGRRLADELVNAGGTEILDEVRNHLLRAGNPGREHTGGP